MKQGLFLDFRFTIKLSYQLLCQNPNSSFHDPKLLGEKFLKNTQLSEKSMNVFTEATSLPIRPSSCEKKYFLFSFWWVGQANLDGDQVGG
jgi:hypothetical protein